jgi:hypothetical protein
MQSDTYHIRDRKKEKQETESAFQQLDWTLDSLGNNLMGMLWQVQLALTVLQEGDNLDQAKKNLQNALQTGDHVKKLMRTVLNSPKLITLNVKGFRLTEYKASCHS